MFALAVRTFLVYGLLVCFMRVTGKRQVGEMQLSELVTALLISEIAASPLSSPEVPLLYGLIPAVLLIALELFCSFLVTKSPAMKKLLDGSPSFLIYNGKLRQEELERQRISVDELLSALRQKDVPDLSGVRYAILEQNGRLSVFCDPAQDKSSYAHPLVVDGVVNEKALRAVGEDRNRLRARLKAHSCPLCDAFLFTVADDGSEFLIRKEKR